ncbi:tRNA pseudouridine(38-40) synthase TruA [Flavobacterium humi]|uniref:tRNA pseudouridine synthase A n=1 Tax=Flavobacterium humi TaxID=2562683 RepID=A0A4Z0L6A8_9FLAO|nr:tRNA pseudouridine(38-40) synthase TruA [Flavobacterium humi]TGD58046.1 tRNA pseudouridine(38-40) synthase TruA [Flavobacterium humi]
MRYFIEFAYNGTHYHGWQYQPNASSVQETLNKVLSTLLQEEIDIMGAGRTDAGVHAKQMFGHFDSGKTIDVPVFIHKANSFLPKDIVVYDIIAVHEEAHARFDAVSRTYHYHISTYKNVFHQELAWQFGQKLDVEAMNEAAKLLLEYTDFKCFSKSNTDVNTYNCKITKAFWTVKGDELVFTISADRFLRNMVRAIVGTLINIGLHKITIPDFIQIIESRSREKAGFSVPAHGLYLTQITYPYLSTHESI